MLKETEAEETTVFCDIFIISSISIGGALPGPDRESFPGGTEIDAGPPKLSKELTDHSEKVFTQIWSDFLPKIR